MIERWADRETANVSERMLILMFRKTESKKDLTAQELVILDKTVDEMYRTLDNLSVIRKECEKFRKGEV
jgi:hypothetical protein